MKAKQKSPETRHREDEHARKAAASKKRPAAHAARSAKAASAEKAAPAAATAREKPRAKGPAPKKVSAASPAEAAVRHAGPTPAAPAPEKRPLGLERRAPVMPEDRQSQLKLLIARGKDQGYLTYAQVNDHLPSEIVDPEQIEDIVNTINDMGIPVYEKAPDTESLLATEPSAPADEEAIEEAAAALAALDAELGRTTDPV
ncbi:MAG: RNA polymerase sigma factor region1.1 domain-containing protein, partial [Opitutaceae bacterium]